ncbi:hypothetical protein EJ08DRAFT_701483 [Tothia fuscella]|uniref:Uncharacterized protein n=1 Tax=Tothia fuscella TaxID=1048955 RepID=A0A9P4NIY5_9PEZI|nr:hypothetical protein EJ08DRAFT_701483 [Tothia fuscella]
MGNSSKPSQPTFRALGSASKAIMGGGPIQVTAEHNAAGAKKVPRDEPSGRVHRDAPPSTPAAPLPPPPPPPPPPSTPSRQRGSIAAWLRRVFGRRA